MSATSPMSPTAPTPARKVQAKIARTSGELDPRTRTLFVELEVDNKDHFLVPGSFAYVTLARAGGELSRGAGGGADRARHPYLYRRCRR